MQFSGAGSANIVSQLQGLPSLDVAVKSMEGGGSELTLVRRAAL